MLTFTFDPLATYLVAFQAGFNSDWGGYRWKDGIAGPVSSRDAERLCSTGSCRVFPLQPGHHVEWVRKGDIWEAFYLPDEYPVENAELFVGGRPVKGHRK